MNTSLIRQSYTSNLIHVDFYKNNKMKHQNHISLPPSLYTSDGRIKPSAADPIKNKETIQAIKDHLFKTGKYGHRNYLIFTTGINIGRRAGDLLKLEIKDVIQHLSPLTVRTEITHIEEKTGKKIEFYFNDAVKEALADYLNKCLNLSVNSNLNSPLFRSQKKSKFNPEKMTKEEDQWRLTTRAYWKILKDVKEDLELNLNLSTHSMRKTFGFHKYQEFKNQQIEGDLDVVDMLQDAYGHNSRKQVLTYIGISKENKQRLYCESSL